LRRSGIETLWRDAASHLHVAADVTDLLARAAGAVGATGGIGLTLLPLALASLVAVVARRRASTIAVACAAVAGLLAWALTGALGRFALPALALLTALAACLRRPVLALGAVALGAALVLGAREATSLYGALGGLAVAGRADDVYSALVVSNPHPGFRACTALDRRARVLFVGEPRGLFFPRRFATSSQHDTPPLADLLAEESEVAAVVERLRERGFTHLLVNVPEMRRLALADRYPVRPWLDTAGRARFVELTRHLEPPVLLEGELVVYALEHRTSGASSR
jgi:hypothetical protein